LHWVAPATCALKLNFQTTKQTTDGSSKGGDVAWQAMKDQGQSVDTAQRNQFTVASFTHTEKSVSVQVGTGVAPPAADPKTTLQATVDSLKTQPGMAWMGQLQSDPKLQGKIDWNAVTLAHDSWDYKQQGLTPAAAAVVTLIVAYFTAGAATGAGAAVGGAAGDAAFVSGASAAAAATVDTIVAGAVAAGVGALASEAAVALLNNKGDVGGALHDVGSSANVKGLVSAVLTGGVLAGLSMPAAGVPAEGAGASKFVVQLQQNLTAGAAKAVINSAIYGTSLEDSLKTQLKGAFLDTVAGQDVNLAFAAGGECGGE
jgi:filamentous hemagglutinin